MKSASRLGRCVGNFLYILCHLHIYQMNNLMEVDRQVKDVRDTQAIETL